MTLPMDVRVKCPITSVICPFGYWKARDGNSESTGVVNFIKVRTQKSDL